MKPLREALISKDKRKWATTGNKYGITKKDMINDIEGFPVGVVVKMMEEQEKQGNKPNIKIFQRNRYEFIHNGGFDWEETECKGIWWQDILFYKHWNNFFEKYPEYEKYN